MGFHDVGDDSLRWIFLQVYLLVGPLGNFAQAWPIRACEALHVVDDVDFVAFCGTPATSSGSSPAQPGRRACAACRRGRAHVVVNRERCYCHLHRRCRHARSGGAW